MRRRVVTAALATLLLAAPTASAELRSGTLIDRRDDVVPGAVKPSGLDIAQVDSRYDTTTGDIVVDVQMHGDIAAASPNAGLMVSVGALGPAPFRKGQVCGGAGEGVTTYLVSGNVPAKWGYFPPSSVSVNPIASGATEQVRTERRFAFRMRDAALRGLDLRCVEVSTTTFETPDPWFQPHVVTRDKLDRVLYFKGYAPDNDADGTTDDIDDCPDVKGTVPRGCPVASGPVPAAKVKRCPRVSLRGKTLKAARKALTKASCSVGTVKKPKGRGKLVVRRAAVADANRRVDLVLKVRR